jgi:hypothetical protein
VLFLLSPLSSSSTHGLQELTKEPKESLHLTLGFCPPELAQLLNCEQSFPQLLKFGPHFIHHTLLTCRLACAWLRIQHKIDTECVIFGGVQSSLTLFIADWTSLRALGFVFRGDNLLFRLLLVLLFLLPFGFVPVALFSNDLDLWVVVIVYTQCTTMKKKR